MEKTLTMLVVEVIEKPLSLLDYNQPLEEVIAVVDGLVDEYIMMAKKLVEIHLIREYRQGVDNATTKLNAAAGQEVDYKPLVPDVPEKLRLLVGMQQRNVEDYALVLRGRLRSSIEAKFWLD